MGFFVKTVCPDCGLVTDQYFEGNGFNETNAVTTCRCGYAYDNRSCVVEMKKDEEATMMKPDWAERHAGMPDKEIVAKTTCPSCGYAKRYRLQLKNLDEFNTLTECKCGYLYHSRTNMTIEK